MADHGTVLLLTTDTVLSGEYGYVPLANYDYGAALAVPAPSGSEPGDPLTAFPRPGEFTTFPAAP